MMYPLSPTTPRSPFTSSTSNLQAARFSGGSFSLNGRVALALLPCLAVLASYGGGLVAAVLLVSAGGRAGWRREDAVAAVD